MCYDLAFVGFPIHRFGPDRKAREFLEHQRKGRNIALFITHAALEGQAEVAGYLAKSEEAPAGANLVGMFNCQGELAKGVKLLMSVIPDPKVRAFAKEDNSKGQPDAARLERARVYAREIMAQFLRA